MLLLSLIPSIVAPFHSHSLAFSDPGVLSSPYSSFYIRKFGPHCDFLCILAVHTFRPHSFFILRLCPALSWKLLQTPRPSMQRAIIRLLPFVHLAICGVLPRQDPGLQSIPATSQDPSTFWNQAVPELVGEPPQSSDPIPSVYGARSVDLPFYRLYHGNMKFFAPGQLNTATGNTDVWNSNSNGVIVNNDNANQSACGIPDNAFIVSKVAIHPYFLKFAPLDRKSWSWRREPPNRFWI